MDNQDIEKEGTATEPTKKKKKSRMHPLLKILMIVVAIVLFCIGAALGILTFNAIFPEAPGVSQIAESVLDAFVPVSRGDTSGGITNYHNPFGE